MANEEHVKRLKQGVADWNAWREREQVAVDLSGLELPDSNLSGVDLTGTDLTRVDLSGADLTGANLSGVALQRAILILADLTCANLTGAELVDAHLGAANLSRAKLCGADLNAASLTGSVLKEADLTGAALSDANLSGTDLTRTNLTEATLGGTVFGETNLSSVIGLDSCEHLGPSPVDFGTLLKSGPLPLPFLRGIGLPDDLIEYLSSRAQTTQIVYHSCFISYSSKNQDFAHRLHADLQNKACAVGLRRMTCQSAAKFLTKSTLRSECGTRCC